MHLCQFKISILYPAKRLPITVKPVYNGPVLWRQFSKSQFLAYTNAVFVICISQPPLLSSWGQLEVYTVIADPEHVVDDVVITFCEEKCFTLSFETSAKEDVELTNLINWRDVCKNVTTTMNNTMQSNMSTDCPPFCWNLIPMFVFLCYFYLY